jgi:hypothetical protein
MRQSRFAIVMIALVVCCCPRSASASGYGFDTFQSSATFAYDGGFGAAPIGASYDFLPYTQTPELGPPYSFDGTGDQTGNTSTAQFGFGSWVTDSLVSSRLAQGSGVSQSAPAGGNSAATLMLSCQTRAYSRVQRDDETWRNPGCMTDIVGWYNFPLVATVSNQGYVDCQLRATYTGFVTDSTGGHKVFDVTLTDSWYKDTPGVETRTLGGLINLQDLVPTTNLEGDKYYWLEVGYQITFSVKNDGGPVGWSLPDGIGFGSQGTATDAPEPSSLALLTTCAIGLLVFSLRRRRC